jgi:hypothetical protein
MTEPIRDTQQVRELIEYYLKRGQLRNYCLIVLGLYTALRISDLLRLAWDDVYDFGLCRVRDSFAITEKKTGKTKIVALNQDAIQALTLYAGQAAKRGAFLIENTATGKALSRIQAYRIVRAAAEALEFRERVSCHSLRKTFGYHAWKDGVSPTVIMDIYNHSSFAVTRRYLGVTQDDKNEAYRRLHFSARPPAPESESAKASTRGRAGGFLARRISAVIPQARSVFGTIRHGTSRPKRKNHGAIKCIIIALFAVIISCGTNSVKAFCENHQKYPLPRPELLFEDSIETIQTPRPFCSDEQARCAIFSDWHKTAHFLSRRAPRRVRFRARAGVSTRLFSLKFHVRTRE